MKLAHFTLYRYTLPLRRPLVLREREHVVREGYILELESETRVKGWGEMAPLPGFSRETMAQAQSQAELLAAVALGRAMDAEWIWSRAYAKGRAISASVGFGFECAFLDVMARQSGLGLSAVLGDTAQPAVAVNALLCEAGPGVAGEVRTLAEAGYRCFKLKVGRRPLADEISRVREVCEAMPAESTLRLDANRAWSLADAVWFARQAGSPHIEYIEEPVADPEDLHEYCGEAPIRAALDETLVERGARALDEFDLVSAAVLKPTLLGGLVRSLELANRAWDRGITPVVSSAFESGVGIGALAHLAGVLQGPGTAAGLDTYRWLAEDVMDPPLDMSGGRVDLEWLSRTLSFLRSETLEKVAHG